MFRRTSLVRSCLGILALCGLSSPVFSGQVLFDAFNDSGGVPKNWAQVLGAPGFVQETPHDLTITDATGLSAGIASSLASSVLKPESLAFGAVTIQAQINSVNPDGNAIFGLIGPNTNGAPITYLAAGIDARGDVFIIEPGLDTRRATVSIGTVEGYTGGSILLNLIIGKGPISGYLAEKAEVTAPGFDSFAIIGSTIEWPGLVQIAFPNGAIPALFAASQPGTTGGSASFGSIAVSTGLGLTSPVPEPSSLCTLAIGLAGLGVVDSLRRRMRSRGSDRRPQTLPGQAERGPGLLLAAVPALGHLFGDSARKSAGPAHDRREAPPGGERSTPGSMIVLSSPLPTVAASIAMRHETTP